jgi:hypothetical protein
MEENAANLAINCWLENTHDTTGCACQNQEQWTMEIKGSTYNKQGEKMPPEHHATRKLCIKVAHGRCDVSD